MREISSYSVIGGKFDLEKINKIYLFDRNYLIKMKYDLDFLKTSRIAQIYEIECEESDPFLVFVNFKNPELEKKHLIKVTEDISSTIRQGQFLILQDLIFYHIFNINNKRNVNLNPRTVSPKTYRFGSSSATYRNNKNNNNFESINFKKAVEDVIKLYSPPKNIVKKLDNRPHSSGLQRKSN